MADLTITAANVLAGANAVTRMSVLGAAVAVGEVVYEDPADSMKLKLADANGATAAQNPVGVALTAGNAGQPALIVTDDDDFTPGGTLVPGTVYVLSANPGKIAPSADAVAGWRVSVLFVAKSTTKGVLRLVKGGTV